MRLVPDPPGRIISGSIRFDGQELLSLPDPAMRAIRGNQIAMIFQEPMSALNPSIQIGRQIAEPLTVHRGLSWNRAIEQAKTLLDRVRVPDAAHRINASAAPVLRRHATTRDDRHGAGLRAETTDRR